MSVNPARTHYDVLAVRDDAPVGVIKAAFNAMAKQHHPDRAGGDAALFSEMTEAMSVLTDARARADYDRELRASRPATASGSVPREQPTTRHTPRAATTAPVRPATTRGASTAYRPPAAVATPTRADAHPALAASHPLQLWLPMTVAMGLSVVATVLVSRAAGPAGTGAAGRDSYLSAALFMVLGAGIMLLVGGHLLERRAALARLGAQAVLGICAAWAVAATLVNVTGFGGVGAFLPSAAYVALGVLSAAALPLVFLAVLTTGVLANDGVRARDWRTVYLRRLALETAAETGRCLWAVLRDVGAVLRDAATGLLHTAVRASRKD